ncbi:4a-hydroxytetrahydrobiopterin dehydratase [Endozoicomonas sp. OPT23]|uniref:4a-hydroxytetrahydrobiopterin dehydratase n=1 Tax=Endozoicomonas sp. OPT23 TaxID=2072845 RepID=UPI00129B7A06|nr:4a-hydroxytetrahydrobiopterin dehydratase [Endozoicomonas sp. OPT23]MRI34344.1 4a-hydroxytetrahydrobiopterin dehydratase [Endozoicomonas sp. OPT23]
MSDWQTRVYDGVEHIEKSFSFKKYSRALCFLNAVAGIAETYIHHPRIVIEWGCVTVAWGTHESEQGVGVQDIDRFLSRETDQLFALFQKKVVV